MKPSDDQRSPAPGSVHTADESRSHRGQRLLLFAFRASAVGFLAVGLLVLGGWRLGQALSSPQPDPWSVSLLGFLFRLAVTWMAAGAIVPILLWSLRAASTDRYRTEEWAVVSGGGVLSLLPPFLALLTIAALATSGSVPTAWQDGLTLLERLDVWGMFEQNALTAVLAVLPIAGVLFVPVVGGATIVSLASGSGVAAAFSKKNARFVRIYAAWLVLHAALILALVHAADAFEAMSGPWLEELNALEMEEITDPDEAIPPETIAYLRDWISAQAARAIALARRSIWIGLACALPLLVLAVRARGASSPWRRTAARP